MLNALVCFSSACWTMNTLLDAYSLIVAKEKVLDIAIAMYFKVPNPKERGLLGSVLLEK